MRGLQGVAALLTFAGLLTLVLFAGRPDPPSAVADLLYSGGWDDDGSCEVANLEQLRHSAIVYTWVNGTERCYNDRRKRAGLPPGGSSRDKEMGELKYSIRSLLKFAPWLEGPIYIVTPGQIPSWLDLNNPRIRVVDQDDLLPKDKAALPNFDTNVIEQYLYKIPGLTDTFIHMNDDYLFVKPIPPSRLFTCDGGLRFLTEINHIRHVDGQKSNAWLASVRNTVKLMDQTYGGEHVYNFIKHAPFVYSRLAFEAIHEKFGEALDKTLGHQIRHFEDLNIPLLHHIYMNEEGSYKLNIPIAFQPLHESPDWLLVRVKDEEHVQLQEQFNKTLKGEGSEVLLALNDEYSKDETARLVAQFYQQLLPERQFYELPAGQQAPHLSNYHGEYCTYDASLLPLPEKKSPIFRRTMTLPASIQNPRKQFNSLYKEYFNRSIQAQALLSPFAVVLGMVAGVACSIYIFRLVNGDMMAHTRSKKR